MSIVTNKLNEVKIIYVTEELLLDRLHEFDTEFVKVLENKDKKVILNLKDVDFINSTALGIILKMYKNILSKKGELVLCNLQYDVDELFSVTKVNNIIKVFRDQEDAVNYFS